MKFSNSPAGAAQPCYLGCQLSVVAVTNGFCLRVFVMQQLSCTETLPDLRGLEFLERRRHHWDL